MRFIHLADAHLADNSTFSDDLGSFIRKNTWQSFENIFDRNKDVDFALIAGDLFERSYFSSKDFARLFAIFEDFSKDIYYVTGNHDYFDSYNKIFLGQKPNNLHIFTSENLSMFENKKIRVYGLSYKDRIYDRDFPYDISLDKDYFNILLAHADISDSPTNYLDLDKDRIRQIGFDYVALGHIHKARSYKNIHYPSIIEPRSFADTGDFGYILYEDGKLSHINSNLMEFKTFDLSYEDFADENALIEYVNQNLSDKKNILRLNIRSRDSINSKNIQKQLRAEFSFVEIDQSLDMENLSSLYPNTLLSKFEESLRDKDDEISKLALKLGKDAILRSKK